MPSRAHRLHASVMACAAIVLLLAPLAGCSRPPGTVVLVTVSGLRSDAVTDANAPVIARTTRGGTVLSTSPETVAALASLMGGEQPDRLGIRFGDLARVPSKHPTLARAFADAGYRTAAFVGEGDVNARSGLAAGFESWTAAARESDQGISSEEVARARSGGAIPAQALAESAASWLRQHAGDGRVFLWIHFGDLPRAASGSADTRAGYAAALADVDGAVKFVEDAIRTYRSGGASVVGLIGTNGLSLGEDGETLAGLHVSDAVVRVPAGIEGAGTTRDARPADALRWRDEFIRRSGLAPANDAAREPLLVATRQPGRQYGWPDEALAASPAGTLRVGSRVSWEPANGAAVTDAAAWTAAPAELRTRLEQAGFKPAAERPDETTALGKLSEARRALLSGAGPEVWSTLVAACDAAPGAIFPRVVLLDTSALLPKEIAATKQADVARALDGIVRAAGDDAVRRIDVAPVLARFGRAAQALPLLRSVDAQRLTPGEKAGLARAFADAGSLDESVAVIESLAAADPDAPELQEWLGDMLNRSGNAFRARTAYENALKSPRAHTANLVAKLGDTLVALGDGDAALQRYAEAVRLDPTYRYPHTRAADVLFDRKQYGAAAHAVVQSLVPSGDPVVDALARAHALARRGLLEAAALELERANAEHPDDRLTVELARIVIDAGDRAKGRAMIEGVLAAHPDQALARVELARLELLEGRPERAVEELDRAEATAGPGLTQRVHDESAFRTPPVDPRVAAKVASFRGRGTGSRPGDAGGAAPR